MWLRWCTLRDEWQLKALPHSPQKKKKCCSPESLRWCFMRLVLQGKALLLSWRLQAFLPCQRKCSARAELRRNTFPHWLHANLLSSASRPIQCCLCSSGDCRALLTGGSLSFGGSGSVSPSEDWVSLVHLPGECSSVGVPCWEEKASSDPLCLP